MSSTPLRILTVANVPPNPNSGAAGTVFHTNAALRELGHDVDEIWDKDLGPRRIQHGNLHSLLEQPWRYRAAVAKATAAKKYDAVMLSQPQAYKAIESLKSNRFPGVSINRSHGLELRCDEVVGAFHRQFGVPESRFPLLTKILKYPLGRQWHRVAGAVDGIVVGSELDKQYLIDRLAVDLEKIAVLPHGVGEDFLNGSIPTRHEHAWKKILHVGQFAFVKGSTLIPEIMNRVLQEHRDASFTWVCSQDHHRWIHDRIDPSIAPRVNLLDWMPAQELLGVIDSHGIFFFPSFFEGFGKAPFEAMARGCCVISVDEGGMHDIISHKKSGILFRAGDVAGAISELQFALGHPELCQKIAIKGCELARTLTWSRLANGLVEFIQRLRKTKAAESGN
ncbi:MAG: glycosyltransferase family 4 protein [Planctomycetaceae bacterium]